MSDEKTPHNEKTMRITSTAPRPKRVHKERTNHDDTFRPCANPPIPQVAAAIRSYFGDGAGTSHTNCNLVRILVSKKIEEAYGLGAVLHEACRTLKTIGIIDRFTYGTTIVAEANNRRIGKSVRCTTSIVAPNDSESILDELRSRAASGLCAMVQIPISTIALVMDDGTTLHSSRPVLIGRSQACDVVVPQACVSAHHARLSCNIQGEWILCDTGSSYGTSVNGRRVSISKLNEGDLITLAESYNISILSC